MHQLGTMFALFSFTVKQTSSIKGQFALEYALMTFLGLAIYLAFKNKQDTSVFKKEETTEHSLLQASEWRLKQEQKYLAKPSP